MSKLKFEEIVSPQDKLTDAIEMIKGGFATNLTWCLTGCKEGLLKSKGKNKDNSKEEIKTA